MALLGFFKKKDQDVETPADPEAADAAPGEPGPVMPETAPEVTEPEAGPALGSGESGAGAEAQARGGEPGADESGARLDGEPPATASAAAAAGSAPAAGPASHGGNPAGDEPVSQPTRWERWLAELRTLPPGAEDWAGVDTFLESVRLLADEAKRGVKAPLPEQEPAPERHEPAPAQAAAPAEEAPPEIEAPPVSGAVSAEEAPPVREVLPMAEAEPAADTSPAAETTPVAEPRDDESESDLDALDAHLDELAVSGHYEVEPITEPELIRVEEEVGIEERTVEEDSEKRRVEPESVTPDEGTDLVSFEAELDALAVGPGGRDIGAGAADSGVDPGTEAPGPGKVPAVPAGAGGEPGLEELPLAEGPDSEPPESDSDVAMMYVEEMDVDTADSEPPDPGLSPVEVESEAVTADHIPDLEALYGPSEMDDYDIYDDLDGEPEFIDLDGDIVLEPIEEEEEEIAPPPPPRPTGGPDPRLRKLWEEWQRLQPLLKDTKLSGQKIQKVVEYVHQGFRDGDFPSVSEYLKDIRNMLSRSY